jgi:hypothetical protein
MPDPAEELIPVPLTVAQVLRAHEIEILRLRSSLETVVSFLRVHSPFAALHDQAMSSTIPPTGAETPQSLRTIDDLIQRIRETT